MCSKIHGDAPSAPTFWRQRTSQVTQLPLWLPSDVHFRRLDSPIIVGSRSVNSLAETARFEHMCIGCLVFHSLIPCVFWLKSTHTSEGQSWWISAPLHSYASTYIYSVLQVHLRLEENSKIPGSPAWRSSDISIQQSFQIIQMLASMPNRLFSLNGAITVRDRFL